MTGVLLVRTTTTTTTNTQGPHKTNILHACSKLSILFASDMFSVDIMVNMLLIETAIGFAPQTGQKGQYFGSSVVGLSLLTHAGNIV